MSNERMTTPRVVPRVWCASIRLACDRIKSCDGKRCGKRHRTFPRRDLIYQYSWQARSLYLRSTRLDAGISSIGYECGPYQSGREEEKWAMRSGNKSEVSGEETMLVDDRACRDQAGRWVRTMQWVAWPGTDCVWWRAMADPEPLV